MRFVRKDVRDLIAHQKNGHGASYRRHRVLQRPNRLKFDFREIFGVVRFSTFATLSANKRHSQPRTNFANSNAVGAILSVNTHVLHQEGK